MSVKNVVAKRSKPTVTPVRYKSQYSIPCPMTKMPPNKIVKASHSFILVCLFMRAATSDRQIVKLLANKQTLKILVFSKFSSREPGPLAVVAL